MGATLPFRRIGQTAADMAREILMADCGATKPGMMPCLRKKWHEGQHTSFAKGARGLDKPLQWDTDPKPEESPVTSTLPQEQK